MDYTKPLIAYTESQFYEIGEWRGESGKTKKPYIAVWL